ncbi:MAG: FG-GAP-like repeat-containing protein [Chitinophagaceae bacterium]
MTSTPGEAASLKQGSWYSNALKNIEESEYQFSWQEENKAWSTPNRKQNLRFYYSEKGFTVEPRTTKLPIGEYDPMAMPGKIKYRYLPDWKIKFELDRSQIGNGNWQVNSNKAEYTTPAVTIQYINNKEGMRQNFIVQKPLQQKGELKVSFNIKTKLKVTLQNNRLQFYHNKKNVLNYEDLNVWDACGKKLNAYFKENKKGSYAIHVDDTNAVYPVTIDPVSTTPAAMMESNQANANMGISVSGAGDVNGDGYGDVIVGAYLYSNGQGAEGAAFVYSGSATGVNTASPIILESNLAAALLGFSVAPAGDVNRDGYADVIVGVEQYSNGQANEGGAFIYHGSAAGINTIPAAKVESNQANANMGVSVSGAGDVNGDGYSDVIVGAFSYDNGQSNEGAAFIYHGSAAGINTTAAARVESNQASALMGQSVAGAGDINGDGYSDVIVGALLYDNGQSNEGATFIYHGSASGINTTPATMVESNQASANLGKSVAGAGDINGDGYSDVMAGAFAYSNGETNEGAVFIYQGSAAGINTVAAASIESNQAGALMGYTVACAGDVNGDGYSEVIVGVIAYDGDQADEGAAFIYYGSATGISITTNNILEGNQAGTGLSSVGGAGDVNGDGYSDVMIGITGYDNGQTDEGAAFVYHGSAAGINTIASAMMESNQAVAYFGSSVASAGDVNADGYSDVIMGAPNYDNGQTDEGAAFVYHGSATGINAIAAVRLENNQAFSYLGGSVASAGDVNGDGYSDIIVGASLYDNGLTDEGAAFIYHGSAAGISTIAVTNVESNQAGALMGNTVASAGDVNGDGYSDIIVGAVAYDNGQANEGAAFVYHGSATGISTTAATMLEANQANAGMGRSVASAGDVNGDGFSDVIVGAYLYDNGETNEGAAFVYHGSYPAGISTTVAASRESNQVNAYFGNSVAAAGDVNGDGFGDIIVGASGYDNGQTDEGAAFIYHGAGAGINTTAATTVESGQADAVMGTSVASAGDVNGDGYSDIIAGAPQYDNVQVDEGAAFVYQGSPAGIIATVAASMNNNQGYSNMGISVACACDINGDGYSDIIAGAHTYNNGESSEGATFIYHGNSTGNGKRNNLRLYNADLVTPMQQTNFNDPNLFGAGLFVKSPQGRQKGKLVWETVANGNPFSGSPITNSVLKTGQDPAFTDLGLTGIELKHQIAKQIPAKATYIRTRVKYDPVTSITGQVYGPWRYPTGFLQGRRDIGSVALPVKFLAFTVTKQNEKALLRWITVDETPDVRYEVQHSTDGIHFNTISTIPSQHNSRSEYEWLHTNPSKGKNQYRIRAVELAKEVFTATRLLTFEWQELIKLHPNPVKSGGTLTIESKSNFLAGKTVIQLVDMNGRQKMQYTISNPGRLIYLSLPEMPSGQYMLHLINEKNELYSGKFILIK